MKVQAYIQAFREKEAYDPEVCALSQSKLINFLFLFRAIFIFIWFLALPESLSYISSISAIYALLATCVAFGVSYRRIIYGIYTT